MRLYHRTYHTSGKRYLMDWKTMTCILFNGPILGKDKEWVGLYMGSKIVLYLSTARTSPVCGLLQSICGRKSTAFIPKSSVDFSFVTDVYGVINRLNCT